MKSRARSIRSWIFGGSVVLHAAFAVAAVLIPKPERAETAAIELADIKKKKEPPKPPPPPPPPREDKPKPPPPPPRAQSQAKVAAQEATKAEALPPMPVGADGFADLGGVALGNGSGGEGRGHPGRPRSSRRRRRSGRTPTPKAVTKKAVQQLAPAGADACAQPVVPPKRVVGVKARYTREGQQAEIEGLVRVQVTVDESGKVIAARVLSGLGYGLDEAAVEAAKKCTFEPATLCGQARSSGRRSCPNASSWNETARRLSRSDRGVVGCRFGARAIASTRRRARAAGHRAAEARDLRGGRVSAVASRGGQGRHGPLADRDRSDGPRGGGLRRRVGRSGLRPGGGRRGEAVRLHAGDGERRADSSQDRLPLPVHVHRDARQEANRGLRRSRARSADASSRSRTCASPSTPVRRRSPTRRDGFESSTSPPEITSSRSRERAWRPSAPPRRSRRARGSTPPTRSTRRRRRPRGTRRRRSSSRRHASRSRWSRRRCKRRRRPRSPGPRATCSRSSRTCPASRARPPARPPWSSGARHRRTRASTSTACTCRCSITSAGTARSCRRTS